MTEKEQEEKAERDAPVSSQLASATGAFNTTQKAPPVHRAIEVKSNEHVPLGPVRVAPLNSARPKTMQSKLTEGERQQLEQATPRKDSPSQQSVCVQLRSQIAQECRELAKLCEAPGQSNFMEVDKALERTAQFIALLQSARRLNLP